jgi:hypothetical protein
MARDALVAYARDELGISDTTAARPVQAALASAAAFLVGWGTPPIDGARGPTASWLKPSPLHLCCLWPCWCRWAKTDGANVLKAAIRVTFWGAFAMLRQGSAQFLVRFEVPLAHPLSWGFGPCPW